MHTRKRFLSILMAVVLCVGLLPVGAMAANDESSDEAASPDLAEEGGIQTLTGDTAYPDVGIPETGDLAWGATHSKEATNLEYNEETERLESTVTLSVSHDVDVVIVQDGTNLVNATSDFIKDLANQRDVHINCGMVIFGGTAPICWSSDGLYDLSVGSNVEYLISGLEEDAWEPDVLWNHSGSNLQAGLRAAERMLENDEKLTASDKYIVFMSDCAARMWLNDDDEVMAKSYMIGDGQWFFDGTEDWIQRYGRYNDANYERNSDPSPENIHFAYPHTFQEVWNAGQNGAPIDEYTMTFEEWQAKRDAGDIDGSVRITNAGSDPHSNTMEEYYASYEAATYHTAEEFIEAAGMANIELVTFAYYGWPILPFNYGEYINSFQGWLGDLDNITRYEYLESDSEGKTENESYIFEHILEQIKSTEVGQGVLIDEIGETDEYDFDFIDEIERFHLIAGKDEYACTEIEPTEGATSAYGFGDANGSDDGTTYPFILRYYQDGYTYTDPYDGTTTTYGECFALEFNTMISKFYEYDDSEGVLYNGVSFTYDIYLTNPQEETGIYGEYDQYGENNDGSADCGLYTNNQAVLFPQTSSGIAEPKQEFPQPTVSYQSIEVEKEWEDAEDQDGIRPDSILVELIEDGEPTGRTITLSREDDWKGSFVGLEIGSEGTEVGSVTVSDTDDWSVIVEGLDKYDEDGREIVYSFTEDAVEGYNTTVNGSAVTNTKTVGVSGSVIWEDDEDIDGTRPESVTICLCADGVLTDKKTVTAADDWEWSFDSLDKYAADGEEIVYTITEDAIDGYTSEVDGYTVINTSESDAASPIATLSSSAIAPYPSNMLTISGSVTWYDGDDVGGNRPESVLITLYGDEEYVDQMVVSAEDGWEWSFGSKARYGEDNEEIDYTVTERTVDGGELAGYRTTVSLSTIRLIIYSNTYEVMNIAATDVSGSVTWLDNDNENKIRPDSLTVCLYANGVQVTDESGDPIVAEVTAQDDWSWSFEGLDKYSESGVKNTYTIIVDGEVEGYSAKTQGYNVSMVEQTSDSVEKFWNDGDNADGSRPESVTIHIYANRSAHEYAVQELDPDGELKDYTATVYGDAETGFVISNVHVPNTIDIEVTKIWENDEDYNHRPDSIEVELIANDVETEKTITLSEDNDWSDTFTDLAAKENGEEIVYTVKEISDEALRYYTPKITYDDDGNATIINYREFFDIDEEIVTDENDRDSWVKNESVNEYNAIEIEMSTYLPVIETDELANGAFTMNFHEELDSELILDEADANFAVTIAGQRIDHKYYTVEIDPDDGCSFHVDVDLTALYLDGVITEEDLQGDTEIMIFFYADLEGTDLNGTYKSTVWYEVRDGEELEYTSGKDVVWVYTYDICIEKYDSETEEALADATFGLYYDPECTEPVSRNKEAYTVVSGEDGTAMFYGLAEGTYYVTEREAPSGYVRSEEVLAVVLGEDLNDNGYTYVGRYANTPEQPEPETVEVNGSKIWDDADDQDGKRPESITIHLLADGAEADSKTVTAADDWIWSFTDLPKYKDGQEIQYNITEDSVEDYSSEITTSKDGETGDYTVTVTNSYTPGQTSLNVTKVWDDADDQDGIRPENVTVALLADGEETGQTLTLDASNNWQGSFTELDVNTPVGQAITYTIEEVGVEEYTGEITGDAATGYVITNTHTPETVEVSGSKTWDDADDQDGKRPESIRITLLADGVVVDTVTVTEADDWAWSFTDLAKYADGKEIAYSITEEEVEDYTTTYDGYNVTNTHTPGTVSVPVTKVWDDEEDADGIRPDRVVIELLKNGEATGQLLTLDADNDWTGSFYDLAEYTDGVKNVYTVQEQDVEGYTAEITGDAETGFVVTNTHTPDVVNPDTGNPDTGNPDTGNPDDGNNGGTGTTGGTTGGTSGTGSGGSGSSGSTTGAKTDDAGSAGLWMILAILAAAVAGGSATVRVRRQKIRK